MTEGMNSIRLNGGPGEPDRIGQMPDFLIVPIGTDGRLYLYRGLLPHRHWGFPKGPCRRGPHSDPLEVARVELRQEIGLAVANITWTGQLLEGCGSFAREYNLFLATVSGESRLKPRDLAIRTFSVAETERMIGESKIADTTTVAAFTLLRIKKLL